MVIVLDEKLPPPPPYVAESPHTSETPTAPAFRRLPSHNGQLATFSDLPPHIVLHIVYSTFPSTSKSRSRYRSHADPAELVHHRQILYWIEMSLRLVNRATYIACMNVLRSVYLPSYQSYVRPMYSSDPFPLATPPTNGPDQALGRTASSSTAGTSSQSNGPPPAFDSVQPLISMQRETAVLDLFIAAKVREDVWLDETELHLEREETFKDLFDLNQPRARIEDLVRFYGTRSGAIYTTPPSPSSSDSGSRSSVPFASLSVSFSPRQVGLQISTGPAGQGRRRTIASADRARDEKLEVVAKKLVRELDRARAGTRGYGG